MIDAIFSLASELDRMDQHDLSDALDRLMPIAETRPAAQPQIQHLSPELTTMRGPAGWALLEDEEREDAAAKQVKETTPRKMRPRSEGLSVGVDVLFDSKRTSKPSDHIDG